MELLRNPIRGYAWGSRSAIAAIQGRPVPSPEPEAELWIGAHPGDPSRVEPDGVPLSELIKRNPEQMLGAATFERFGPRLPYLMKVLAADAPLSLQAHPDPDQAAAGFAAEEAAGVPRGAPHRRYADAYHKPELLVAVSEFRALCGFRIPGEAAEVLGALELPVLAPVVDLLQAGKLAEAVGGLLAWPESERAALVTAAVAGAERVGPGYELVTELATRYPGDVGVLVALLLNQVRLLPGEAIYMPAGNLHAYLSGVGVEIMAASDNVLRGGLTPKHVDVAELLRVLTFEPLVAPVRPAEQLAAGLVTWPVPVPDFTLHRVRPDRDVPQVRLVPPGPRTVLCLAGTVAVSDGVSAVTLPAGSAAFGGPVGELTIRGEGEAYVASSRI